MSECAVRRPGSGERLEQGLNDEAEAIVVADMNLARTARNAHGGRFDDLVVAGLRGFNGFLHIMLAVALVAASIMVVWEFIGEVGGAVRNDRLGAGFLHALGTLFILWTLSALITAEIGYIRSGQFHLRVFIEVAMITLLRQLIVRPVQQAAGDAAMDWIGMAQLGAILGGLLIIAVVHRLVSRATALSASRDGNGG